MMLVCCNAPPPSCLVLYSDSDLKEKSRYCVYALLNGAPIKSISRVQPSVATDITDSEAHGYSIAGILAEVIRSTRFPRFA